MTKLSTHSEQQRKTLLQIAREAIDYGLAHQQRWTPKLDDFDAKLAEPGASFVTLNIENQLRGCIGSLTAVRPLLLDVADNAYNAAFRDPRFEPLTPAEWPHVHLHLSLIGPSEPIPCDSEAELLTLLRPKLDGLILDDCIHRATFLPSVWESLVTPLEFVHHLKRKAGLASNAWPSTMRCYRYEVENISDN